MRVTSAEVTRTLEDVHDPELGLSVVALGLVYGVDITEGRVRVTMTLTTPGCPNHDAMLDWVRQAVMALPGVEDVEVVITFDPPWTPDRMTLSTTP
jgi:metal-sulfur cluster biosynthetic enzyme